MKNPLLPLIPILGISLFATSPATHAQQLISSLHGAYAEDFDSFDGTAATVPDHFTFVQAVEGMTYNGYYSRTDAYGNLSRVVALRDSPSSSDVAFGMKPATSGVSTLDWTFVNDTGLSISSFVVAWDFEQYSESGRATRVSLSYSLSGSGFTVDGMTGSRESTATTRPPGVPPGGQNLTSILVDSKLVTVDLETLLAPGEQVVFRWNFISGAQIGDSNNNAYVGVDNLSVTAIPEPSFAMMVACAAGSLLWLRARRRI